MQFRSFESRIPELDGVRGIAILLVIFFHCFGIPQIGGRPVTGVLEAFHSLSWSGVDLFFVLSGFLIGGILTDNRDSGSYFRTFYIRRICRIIPLYFLWVSLFLVLPLLLPSGFPAYSKLFQNDIPHFPKWGYFLFIQNFYAARTGNFGCYWLSITWSLAIEEQFYLLLPALIRLVFPRRTLLTFVVLIALVPVLRVYLFLFHPGSFVYVLLPCRADALLLGVACACVLRQESGRFWLIGNKEKLYVVFCVLTAAMVYLAFLFRKTGFLKTINSFEMATFGFSVIALFYACFLLIVLVHRNDVFARVTRLPLLRHFGILAYGLYLSHRAVNAILKDFVFGAQSDGVDNFGATLVSILALLLTWGLAALSWRFFERPIIRWGHSFSYAPGQGTQGSRTGSNEPLAPAMKS